MGFGVLFCVAYYPLVTILLFGAAEGATGLGCGGGAKDWPTPARGCLRFALIIGGKLELWYRFEFSFSDSFGSNPLFS